MRRPFLFICGVLSGVALDQITKSLVRGWLPLGGRHPVIEGWFHFTNQHNTGVAFSLLADYPNCILLFSMAVIVGVAWWYATTWRTSHPAYLWAQGLILSGTAGNVIDRVRFGYVRDFLHFCPKLPLIGEWPVFNLADTFLCVGVGIIVVAQIVTAWVKRREEQAAAKRPRRKP